MFSVFFLNRISQDRLTGLLKWYEANGLVPKEKRSGGRRNNTRAHSFEDIQRAVAFVSQYAEHHALVLPGRVPGFKRDDVKLLPSAETKAKVYGVYAATMKDSGMIIKTTYMHLQHEILINTQYFLCVTCLLLGLCV